MGLDVNYAAVGFARRRFYFEHGGFGVERVAAEGRRGMADGFVFESRDRVLADVLTLMPVTVAITSSPLTRQRPCWLLAAKAASKGSGWCSWSSG